MFVRTAGLRSRTPGAPVVVLEAGGGQTSETWSGIFGKIAAFAPVVAYDRRGLGRSEWDSVPPTPERISRNLRSLLKAADVVPPYILVGHSLGGAYIRTFAGLFAKEVGGLVFLDPTTWQVSIVERRTAFLEAGATEDEWKQLVTPREPPSTIPPGARAEMQIFTAWSNDDRWSKWFADLPPLGETPVAFLIARRPSPPRAAAAGSKLDPQKAMKAIAALTLDRITSTVLENRSNLLLISTSSGHYIHNDEPELTIGAIRRVVNIAAGKK